jgi:hypothetical protein
MWTLILILGLLTRGITQGITLDVRIEPVHSSPGLYCQFEAEARLHNSQWKVVTYLNLQQASDNVDTVTKYIDLTIHFCRKHDKTLWLNLTECRTTIHDATRKLTKLKEMRNLLVQLTKNERQREPRVKRGLFNFIGQISHSLFGTLDSDNEEFYNEKIS